MDRSIPPAAAILLEFIYRTETSRRPPECYDVIFGNRQSALPKPLTSMTLGDVIDAQKTWSTKAWAKRFGSTKASSAAGAPQFMRATLIDLSKELHLRGDQVFDPDLQDRLGYHLLKRRGYEDFMAGRISRTEFGKRLAMEWASFPVLAATQGQKRKVQRGQSYYAGDGLNKALVAPEEVEMVLQVVKSAGSGHTAPFPSPGAQAPAEPKPAPERPAGGKAGILSAIIAALIGAGAWLANLPCHVFGIWCG